MSAHEGLGTREQALDTLWEERQISKVILRFGRCLDTGDWETYRSCFTEHVNMDFKRLTGHDEVRIPAALMSSFGDLFLSQARRHHSYTNFDVTITGDKAYAHVYFVARHWRSTDRGGSTNVQYGWYDFWLSRMDCGWLIHRFRHDFQWVDGNDALFDLGEPALVNVMSQIFTDENKQAALAFTSE